jgi:hypothetical protein
MSRTKLRRRRLFLESLEDRAVPSTVSWINPAGGDWNTAANWSGGAVPNSAQDAVINIAVSGPITLSSTCAAHSLTDTAANLDLTGGSLSLAAASSVIQNLTISEGVLDSAGSLTVGGTMSESGGNLTGSGTVSVGGLLTWTGGMMSGTGTTNALGGLALGASGVTSDWEDLAGRTLINAGAGVWYGPDSLTQEESSTFLNNSAASMTIEAGGTWGFNFLAPDASGTFENDGVLTVADGSASTLMEAFFINTGKVQVNSGTLDLGRGGPETGSLNVASGATIEFGANFNYDSFPFNFGASLSGGGTVDFGAGASANFAAGSTYNVTGTTEVGGNTVVFAPGSIVKSVGALTVTSGVINFSTGSTVTAASLNMMTGGDVGTLTGSDTLDVSGLLTWTDGTMSGSGTTVAEGGLDLGVTDGGYHGPTLEARTFVNQQTANWVGSGEFDVFSGATFVNAAGATFNEKTNDTIWTDVGVGLAPSGLFDNRGTFVVDGGGTAGMESNFDNEGQVEIESGTWELSGAGSSSGSFIMSRGTSLELNKYYGISYTTTSGGAFASSSQIIGGNAANVTLIDGSDAAPALLTANAVIPLPKPPYTSFFETGNDTINSLNMTGGWLTITGTLTVTGPMTWSGGYIAGPGTLIVEGGLQLGTGDGSAGQALYGVTLINKSTITVMDQDSFALQFGAVVENPTNSTIDFEGDSTWGGDQGETIYNEGAIEKTTGTGTTLIDNVSVVNTGSVVDDSGTLDLEGGGIGSGSFIATANSTLQFGHFWWGFNSGSSVNGAGTVKFGFNYFDCTFGSGSTYNVNGETDVAGGNPIEFLSGSDAENFGSLLVSDGSLELSSGSPASAASLTETSGAIHGSDTLTVSGPTTWAGGTMSGTGITVAGGGLQIGLSGNYSDSEYLVARTLVDATGGSIYTGDVIQQYYASTFVNSASATLTVREGVNWENASDGGSTIENLGTLIVAAGSGTTKFTASSNLPFLNNGGATEVSSGTLDLQSNGTSSGRFTVDGGATLQCYTGFSLVAGSSTSGTGTVEISDSKVWVASGASYNVAGTTNIDGGTLEFDGVATTGMLNESNGDLTGPGSLTVNNQTVWTGGTMDGAGTTIAQGSLMLGLAGDANDVETLSSRTLTNSGTATWAGGGSISQTNGGTFVNQASASFEVANDAKWHSDRTGTLVNAGTLTKSAGTGTTILYVPFKNTGSVKVQKGTLSLQNDAVVGGSYLVLAGATLAFGNDNVTTASVTLPSGFTVGTLDWAGTFAGTAQDNSGSGLASVGVSLTDGTHYYNGTSFTSSTPVLNTAALTGNSWTYTILAGNFKSDTAYTTGAAATDNNGGSEPSTITSFLLSPATPTVRAVTPAIGPVAGGTKVTITGYGLANATAVEFGVAPATIVSDTNTAIVVISPIAVAAGSVDVNVTTAEGKSATSSDDHFTYAVAPTSSVAPIPATTTSTTFTVSWHGSDGSGPGIASYSVYVSDNGGAYNPFVLGTTKSSAAFTGKAGHTYGFYSVATDLVGLVQATPTSAQATTTIIAPPLVTVKQVRDITNSKHQVTEVLVTFSGTVNAIEADNTATYRLATAGTGGSFFAKNAGIIKLKSVVYAGAVNTVTLRPTSPFALTKPVELVVYGTGSTGLKDSYGRLIDGDHNGVAGGNAVVMLSSGGPKINALPRPKLNVKMRIR